MILAIIDLRDEELGPKDGDWPARNVKDALQIVSKVISVPFWYIWIFYISVVNLSYFTANENNYVFDKT